MQPLKGLKRPQKASKKASGEATGDHGGSRRLKEGWLVAKNRPRRPAEDQDFSKKPFWYHFGVHFGGLFLHSFESKIGSKFGSVLGFVFGSILDAQLGPESLQHGTRRPEKVPRRARRCHASEDTAF